MQDVNYTPYSFDCSGNIKPYTYYKLDITENKGDTVIQLSELAFTYTADIHNWEEISRTEPTCTTPGKSNQKCTDCDITRTVEIPVIEHNWEEISRTEPTCEEPEYIIKRCSKCNVEKEEPNGTALGHTRNDSGICTRCGI